jgi:hypothetical protein
LQAVVADPGYASTRASATSKRRLLESLSLSAIDTPSPLLVVDLTVLLEGRRQYDEAEKNKRV